LFAHYISKYESSGKENPSYLSNNTFQLIQLIAQKAHALVVGEVKSSGYFSLSDNSTPDLSYNGQLSVALGYLHDGQTIEHLLIFLEKSKKWRIGCCSI